MKPQFLWSVSVHVLFQASHCFSPQSSSWTCCLQYSFFFFFNLLMVLLIAPLIAVLLCQLQESLYLV